MHATDVPPYGYEKEYQVLQTGDLSSETGEIDSAAT